MKPTNRLYGYSPPDSDGEDLIKCTYCLGAWTSYAWRTNNGKCQGCAKTYAGPKNED